MVEVVKRAIRLSIAVGLGAAATHAAAVTVTVSTPGIAFGSYDVFAPGVTNGNGTLTITCTFQTGIDGGGITVSYTVSLSAGSSNSFVQRKMKSAANPANTFGYNLYTTNAYSVVWGDGTGSTSTVSGTLHVGPGPGNNTRSQQYTVYGQVPALQDVAVANDYRDNVTVTVTY